MSHAVRRVALAMLLSMLFVVQFVQAEENAGDSLLPDFYDDPTLSASGVNLDDYEKSSVDYFSGKMSRSATDLSIPGQGGMTLTVQRTYQSRQPFTWDDMHSATGRGWSMHFGWVEITDPSKMCSALWSVSIMDDPVLHMPDGSTDVLALTNEGITDLLDPSKVHYRSKGGIGVVCDLSADVVGGATGFWLVSADGTRYELEKWSGGGAVTGFYKTAKYFVNRIVDRNGNWIAITNGNVGSPWEPTVAPVLVKASDGREVFFNYAGGLLSSIAYAGKTVASYRYDGENLVQVDLGDALVWSYAYSSQTDEGAGSIVSAKNPFGGRTDYTWSRLYFQTGDNRQLNAAVVRVDQVGAGVRTATWRYGYSPATSAGARDMTYVSAPEGSYEYAHFSALGMVSGEVWKVGLKESVRFTPNDSSPPRSEEYTWEPWYISPENNKRTKATGLYAALDTAYYGALQASVKVTVRNDTWVTTNSDWAWNYLGVPQAQKITYTGPAGTFTRFRRYGHSPSRFLYYLLRQDTWRQALYPDNSTNQTNYDDRGNVVARFDKGYWTYFANDATGNVISSTLGLTPEGNGGDPQTTTYGEYRLGVAGLTTYPDGSTASRTIDDFGHTTGMRDRDGRATTYRYDGVGRVTAIDYAAGNDTSVVYRGTQTTLVRGNYSSTKVADPFGRVTEETHVDLASGRQLQVTRDYDNRGQVIFTSYPNSVAGTAYDYDAYGRITRVSHPGGTRTYRYGDGGKTIQCDENGNCTTIIRREIEGPGRGEVIRIESPGGTHTQIDRNECGLPLVIRQGREGEPEWVRSNTYSAALILLSSEEPETGITDYVYDSFAHLVQVVRRDRPGDLPRAQFNQYDVNGRLWRSWVAEQDRPVPDSDITERASAFLEFSYTPGGQPLTQARAEEVRIDTPALGDSVIVRQAFSTWTSDYDANGNLASETASANGRDWTFRYAYDGNDRLATMTYPDGTTVDYAPDAFGWPTRVGDVAGDVSYHASGQLAGFRYGNGKTMAIDINDRWLVSGVSVPGVTALSYGYDAAGNVTGIADAKDDTQSVALFYDQMNRMIAADGPWGSGTFAYDGVGNITRKKTGDDDLAMAYDDRNRLVAVSGSRSHTYAYDAFGNVAARDNATFTYDGMGNLLAVRASGAQGVTWYQYDARGRRIASVVWSVDGISTTTTYSLYANGDRLLYEDTPAEYRQRRNLYIGSLQFARIDQFIGCDEDVDNDGIPHCAEQQAGLNPFDPLDALGDKDLDGVDNLTEYHLGTRIDLADSDADGMPDGIEVAYRLNPLANDAYGDEDDDGVPNIGEVVLGMDPNNAADGAADVDGDGLSAAREYALGTSVSSRDTDGDGMDDGYEVAKGLDPRRNDISGDLDRDGMPNGYEFSNGFDPANATDAAADADADGLSNLEESQRRTKPWLADTDGDGMKDGAEVAMGLDPLVNDSNLDPDADGLSNARELALGTNWNNADTDGDGLPDSYEVTWSLDPLSSADATLDPDGDTLSTLREYQLGTNPRVADSDGDGMVDGVEVAYGFDPHINDASIDLDHDGLPNKWEIDHGLNPNSAVDALQDPDGDGLNIAQEYRIGTDPWVADVMQAINDLWAASAEDANYLAWVGSPQAQSYVVEYGVLGEPTVNSASATTPSTFQHTGLSSNTLYWYRVKDTDTAGYTLTGRTIVAMTGTRAHYSLPVTLSSSCDAARIVALGADGFLFACATGSELAVSRYAVTRLQETTRFTVGRDAVANGNWDIDADYRGRAVLAWIDRGDSGDPLQADRLRWSTFDPASRAWSAATDVETESPLWIGSRPGYVNTPVAFDAVIMPTGLAQVYYGMRRLESGVFRVELRRARYNAGAPANMPESAGYFDTSDVRSIIATGGGIYGEELVVANALNEVRRFVPTLTPLVPHVIPMLYYTQIVVHDAGGNYTPFSLDATDLSATRTWGGSNFRYIQMAVNCTTACGNVPNFNGYLSLGDIPAAWAWLDTTRAQVLWPTTGAISWSRWAKNNKGVYGWTTPATLVSDAGLANPGSVRFGRSASGALLYWTSGTQLRTSRLKADGTWTAAETVAAGETLAAMGVDRTAGNAVIATRQTGQYAFREFRPLRSDMDYAADTSAPTLTLGDARSGSNTIKHVITLTANEPSNIYFSVTGGSIVGGGASTTTEQRYTGPVTIMFSKGGSATLTYRGINFAQLWREAVSVPLR